MLLKPHNKISHGKLYLSALWLTPICDVHLFSTAEALDEWVIAARYSIYERRPQKICELRYLSRLNISMHLPSKRKCASDIKWFSAHDAAYPMFCTPLCRYHKPSLVLQPLSEVVVPVRSPERQNILSGIQRWTLGNFHARLIRFRDRYADPRLVKQWIALQ